MKNKYGWKVDFLDEICDVNYGTRVVNSQETGTDYFVYGGGDATFTINRFNRENCLVIARFAMSKQCVRFVRGKFFLNDSGLTLSIKKSEELKAEFLNYQIFWLNDTIYNSSKGAAQRNLDVPSFRKLKLVIPPIPTQHQIVSELDALSDIFSKKKQQLEELDNLAQATFYDMFGDPVTNEKGWEVKNLGELGNLGRGVSKNRPRNSPELLGGDIPLIQTGDIANAGMYITKYTQTYSQKGLEQSKLWSKNTLCITIAANIGKTSIMTFDACFPDSIVGFTPNSKIIDTIFVYYFFSFIQKDLEDNAPQVAQKNINLEILKNIKVILPPITIQENFVRKIESIEKQKTLINQSIGDVQQLFDYTMDKYFN